MMDFSFRMKLLVPLLLVLHPLPAQAQLEGMIDLHVHAAPSDEMRSVDAFEAARIARRYGMRALLFKDHYTHTASLAYLVSQVVPGIELYGGITLNASAGGLNPSAIRFMAETTGGLGRVVWMPTRDTEHAHLGRPENPDYVYISRNGELLSEVFPVLDVIKQYDLALATGHLSPAESILLIRAARARGIERIIVTHPIAAVIGMSVETQQEASRLGALLEYPVSQALGGEDRFERFLAQLREVGPVNIVLSTDLGLPGLPVHPDGLRFVLLRLMEAGITQAEIDIMTKRNPERFLGLKMGSE